MFFLLSKIFGFLIIPIHWIFISLIASLIHKKRERQWQIATLFMIFFFGNGFIYDELSRLWEVPDSERNKNEVYDIGIVLGGFSDYDKNTNTHNFNKYSDRIIYAEQLYRKGKIKKILISGGNGMLINNSYIESTATKKFLLNNNIPSDDIIIETKSRNTKENAEFTTDIMNTDFKDGKFLVITSANHMRRVLLCFNKYKLDVFNYSTDRTNSERTYKLHYLFIPRSNTLDLWSDLMHEWVGYIAYKINFSRET